MGKAPKIKKFMFQMENVVWKLLSYSLPHFHGLLEKFFHYSVKSMADS